jgi:hypothetical protein
MVVKENNGQDNFQIKAKLWIKEWDHYLITKRKTMVYFGWNYKTLLPNLNLFIFVVFFNLNRKIQFIGKSLVLFEEDGNRM